MPLLTRSGMRMPKRRRGHVFGDVVGADRIPLEEPGVGGRPLHVRAEFARLAEEQHVAVQNHDPLGAGEQHRIDQLHHERRLAAGLDEPRIAIAECLTNTGIRLGSVE